MQPNLDLISQTTSSNLSIPPVLLDAVPGFVFEFDLQQAKLTYINKSTVATLGYEITELLNLDFESLITKILLSEDIPKFFTLAIDIAQAEPGKALVEDLGFVSKAGNIIWASFRFGISAWNEHKQPSKVTAVGIDITERKQAETRLLKENQYLNALHHISLGLINRLNLDELLETIVQYAQAILQTSKGAIFLLNENETAMVLKFGVNINMNTIGMVFEKGQGLAGKVWEDGQTVVLSNYYDLKNIPPHINPQNHVAYAAVGVPLKNEDKIVGIITISYEQPNRVVEKYEVEMLDRFANLASLAIDKARLFQRLQVEIEERKKTEGALAHARDQALEASRLKSQFLANMSHEIRTPINGIIGSLDLLSFSQLDIEQRELIAISHQSAELLLALINDILDLSKIEANKLDLEVTQFKPAELVEEVVKVVAFKAYQKQLQIVTNIPTEANTYLLGDAVRLRQVLLNLVNNAVKFTEIGEVAISVKVPQAGVDGLTVRFEVVDTGVGIAPTAQKNLFEAFMQADNSTSRKYGGTGLGLAICQRLVDLMKGNIGFESELNKGSLFWFEIPFKLVQTNLPVIPAVQKVKGGNAVKKELPEDFAILLVEDNPVNQKIIARQLKTLGVKFDTVANGIEAIGELKIVPYDLVLMDCQMPVMDGYETTRLLRLLEQKKGLANKDKPLTIVALTANAMAGDKERCLEAGMDDYISKPITAEQLCKLTEKWLK
jgi:PAS domain S-box-containing protein